MAATKAHAPGPGPEPATHAYARLLAKTQEERLLLSVHWELTYRCNQRCSHCYLDTLPPSARVPDELTTAECLDVLDQLAAAGALNLTLSGGEALLRPDFFTIARQARARHFLLRLFTNGTLIDAPLADAIAALHPYAVEISLYGADAVTHEGITGCPHSFHRTIHAFRLLRQRGVRTVLKTPLMRENVRQFRALESLAQELGAIFRYNIIITPKDSGDRAPLRHRLTKDDLLWFFRQVPPDPTVWREQRSSPEQGTCAIGSNALVIDPYGNVFPCVQMRLKAGNLRHQPLLTIWREAPIWQELRSLTLSRLPACRNCPLHNLCVRCHGLALLEDGDLYGPASANCLEAAAREQALKEAYVYDGSS